MHIDLVPVLDALVRQLPFFEKETNSMPMEKLPAKPKYEHFHGYDSFTTSSIDAGDRWKVVRSVLGRWSHVICGYPALVDLFLLVYE